MRQRILYAEEIWKRQRLFPLFFITVGTVLTATVFITGGARFTGSSWIWPLYILSGVVYGGGLLYYRWRSQAEVTDAGLKISNLRSSHVIPYDTIRLVRVQPLARHFEDSRKKFIRPINRALLARPALFVRLRADQAELSEIRRIGYGVCVGEFEDFSNGVSAAVLDLRGRPVVIVNIWGPSQRVTRGRLPSLGRAVLRAAHEISVGLE